MLSLKFLRESTIDGDLFNAPETYKVVTVNQVGAMGRGIALSCKERYPNVYREYRKACREKLYFPDDVMVFEEEKIILLATKDDWKAPSTVEIITRGLYGLSRQLPNLKASIAIPPLGMVNGWLKKSQRAEIFSLVVELFHKQDCNVRVYLPDVLYEEVRELYHSK
ncbi:putative APPr-1-p processing domain protein [Erwinia phage Derbicus]|uniref:Appr-1-p processing protein n=2 Tax=Derbicusvirus derbicus TaxID=2734104 RepID=A0A1B2ICM9_9CAUD|nr:hypothetical protein BIZ82_gp184 [Erwinia phage vB_EamM_EarlPhillipIV]YP_009821227.1 putative APPr-1-p processing domain protein [Erwinia phage Derbicus]ANZ49033.1 hypothetical protein EARLPHILLIPIV_184 [Erwinia phage vB_EamM_EarlPhillipIV]QBP07609.1 putative APPr-1-p processing domain protein [Erwinia phage Derbicus]